MGNPQGSAPEHDEDEALQKAIGESLRLSAPEKVFLNLGSEIEEPCIFGDLPDVTWCKDKIDSHDVEYIRADLARRPSPTDGVREADGIYIASKTRHADKWLKLRADGVSIISTWIDEAGPGETESFSDLWLRCIDESARCACLIIYAEGDDVLKGAFVELGCALANKRKIFAVGLPANLSVLNHPLIKVLPNIESAIEAARAALGGENKG